VATGFGGTIDHRAGGGMMIFCNDPLPSEEPEPKQRHRRKNDDAILHSRF